MARTSRAPLTVVLAFVAAAIPASAGASGQDTEDKPRPLDVEARLMIWAVASERESVPDQNEDVRDLLVRRLRVVLQGNVSPSISYSFQFGQDNIGAKVSSGDESIRIKDAYVNYRAANWLQLVGGQFKIPFLRANLESAFGQIMIERAALPTLRPAREGSRDLGVMAWGNIERLQYRVALFDGSDQELENPGSSFRVASRVAYNWFTSETRFGYTGTYLGSRRVLQVAGQVDVQGDRVDSRDDDGFEALVRDYRAYALEAFFEQPLAHGWAVTAGGAWFDRADDYEASALPTRRLQGYYVQPGLLLPGRIGPGQLQLVFRREDWTTERGSVEASTTLTVAGATYYLRGHDRKLHADFTRKREEPEVRNDEFRLSVVVVF